MELSSQKIIRSIRLILACITLFLLTWYFQLPEREWGLITIWFVMFEYTNIGGVLKKSFFRFFGTVLSAIYGMVVIYFFDNNVLINMVALTAGVFIYAYYFLDGDKTYIAVIGAVTLTIVLLNHNTLDAAILRVFNIILGILISMFMIRFFLPTYAKDQVIELQFNFLEQLSQILESYLNQSKSLIQVQAEYAQYEKSILSNFVLFNRLISEAALETKSTPLFITYNKAAMTDIRHLFRLLSVFINYLSTEDNCTNVKLRATIAQLLTSLRFIQNKLHEGAAHNANLPSKSGASGQHAQAELIIDSMENVIINLDENMTKMIVSYKQSR